VTPTADVVVVGAGIVGASVAYHLARAGSDVVLLDKALPASGATGDSFAWIGRGTVDAPPEQLLLRRQVLSDYRRLERELPGVHVRWTGSLSWRHDEPAAIDDDARDRQDSDASRVAQLEPQLLTPPARAALRADDGAVDPVAVVEALIGGARDRGATIRSGIAVEELTVRDHTVVGVHTSAGFLPARTVVLASGADAPVLCAPLGFALPVTASPALLMRFSAAPGVVRTLVSNDDLEVREAADGHLLAAWDYDGQTQPTRPRPRREAAARRAEVLVLGHRRPAAAQRARGDEAHARRRLPRHRPRPHGAGCLPGGDALRRHPGADRRPAGGR